MTRRNTTAGPRRVGVTGVLPAKFTYVIQFAAEAADPSLPICGRIEHVVSGRQQRFGNVAEMLHVLEEMLDASRHVDV